VAKPAIHDSLRFRHELGPGGFPFSQRTTATYSNQRIRCSVFRNNIDGQKCYWGKILKPAASDEENLRGDPLMAYVMNIDTYLPFPIMSNCSAWNFEPFWGRALDVHLAAIDDSTSDDRRLIDLSPILDGLRGPKWRPLSSLSRGPKPSTLGNRRFACPCGHDSLQSDREY
jgi:hypothetical protein